MRVHTVRSYFDGFVLNILNYVYKLLSAGPSRLLSNCVKLSNTSK